MVPIYAAKEVNTKLLRSTAHHSSSALLCESYHSITDRLMNMLVGRKETKTIVHSDHAFATVAYLEVKDAVLEDNPQSVALGPAIPPMLDDLALRVQSAYSELPHKHTSTNMVPTAGVLSDTKPNIHTVGSWAYISNVQHVLPSTDAVVPIEDEVNDCFRIIKGMWNPKYCLL